MTTTLLERIALAIIDRLYEAFMTHERRVSYRDYAPWGVS